MKNLRSIAFAVALTLALPLYAQNTPPKPSDPPPATVPVTSQTPMTAGQEPANSGVPADSPQTAGKAKKQKHKKTVPQKHAPATSTPPS